MTLALRSLLLPEDTGGVITYPPPALVAWGALAESSGTGPATPAYPGGITDGLLALALVGVREDATSVDAASGTTGWTRLGQIGDGDQVRLGMFAHPYVAGDPAPSFVASGGSRGANGVYGAILTVSNAGEITVPTGTFGNVATMNAPATDGAAGLDIAGYISSNDVAHSGPSPGALAFNYLSTLASQCALSAVYADAPAGAAGPYGLTQASSARYQWCALTARIAQKPPTLGAAPTGQHFHTLA